MHTFSVFHFCLLRLRFEIAVRHAPGAQGGAATETQGSGAQGTAQGSAWGAAEAAENVRLISPMI